MTRIILASTSPFRKMLLKNAGVHFETESADIDERAVEEAAGGSGVSPEDMATILAEAKANDVAARYPEALIVLGGPGPSLNPKYILNICCRNCMKKLSRQLFLRKLIFTICWRKYQFITALLKMNYFSADSVKHTGK